MLRDLGDTEIGGFGISGTEDPLLVTDIGVVKQSCSYASVEFDDLAVAEFFEASRQRSSSFAVRATLDPYAPG